MDLRRAHELLGATEDTPIETVSSTYRVRARMMNPDKQHDPALRDEATKLSHELSRAWEVVWHAEVQGTRKDISQSNSPELDLPDDDWLDDDGIDTYSAISSESRPISPAHKHKSVEVRTLAYGAFICGIVYLAGLLTLGSHTETYNKERFGEIFSENVVNSGPFEALNGHFVAVGNALGMVEDKFDEARTPEGWKRVQSEHFSFAIPEDWSTKADSEAQTSAVGPDDRYTVVGATESLDGNSLEEWWREERASLKSQGATEFRELDPITVASVDDVPEAGQAFPYVFAFNGRIIYAAAIATGGTDAMVIAISSVDPDQDAIREFCEKVMDTVVVKD